MPPYLLAAVLAASPIVTTVSEMVRAYQENEIAADARYKGKQLQVRGRVFSVGRDKDGVAYVALYDPKAPDWVVRCFPKSEEKLAKLKNDQRAAIHGVGEGLKRAAEFKLLTLSDCVLP